MKKKRKDNRRQFLKNTSLSLLSVAVFPTSLKPVNSTVSLSKKNSIFTCDQSTEDAYGQGPFYTANAPAKNHPAPSPTHLPKDICSNFNKQK